MDKSIHTHEHERFVTLLIEARRSAGLTQKVLAEKLSKPQSFVSKYERGERRLDVVEFIVVARAIGSTASALLQKLENLPVSIKDQVAPE